MENSYPREYSIDVVFCIDATMSMSWILEKVRENALSFHGDLVRMMERKNKRVGNFRVRVVAFRDYLCDGEDAMMETEFFELPRQSGEFAQCIRSIQPGGGGDDPEDALEALACAIRSDWYETPSVFKRQIIVLWTDAAPHSLGHGSSAPNYPENMPATMEELSAWWGSREVPSPYMSNRAHRLILCSPDNGTWNHIADNWEYVIHMPSRDGEGMQEFDFRNIMDVVADAI